MTTFYLVRHGANDYLGRALAGRLPGVPLNQVGRADAQRVADRLCQKPITHLFSSPMQRTRETAEPLARSLALKVHISEALNEVDFGEWQGAELTVLDLDERWSQWNTFRSAHRLPHGETMAEIQSRMAGEMIRLKNEFPGGHLALFSHGDPIRAALCYWLGMPLDFLLRLEIDPGSISEVAIASNAAVVRSMNLC